MNRAMRRIRGSLFRGSIVSKQMIAYLLMMLPIVCAFIILYQLLRSNMMAHMTQMMISGDKMTIDTFNDQLLGIKRQQITLLGANEAKVLSQLWDEETYPRIERMRSLRERLAWLSAGSDDNWDISLYLIRAGVMISNRITREMTETDYSKLTVAQQNGVISSIYAENDRLVILSLPANELHGGGFVSLMCEIFLKADDIARSLWGRVPDKTEAKLILINGAPFVSRNLPLDNIPDAITALIASARVSRADAIAEPIRMDGIKYLCTLFQSPDYDMALLSLHPYGQIEAENQRYALMAALFALLFAVAALCFCLYFKRFIERPVVILTDAFNDLVRDQARPITLPRGGDEFSRLYERFNDMIKLLKEKNDQVFMHKLETQRSRLKELQAHIDPHFLYNSLFIVKAKVRRGDYDGATRLTELLGEYFRYINRSARDFVPLGDELAHAKTYAQIQNLRFSGRFDIDWQECPQTFAGVIVPRLILQPLVENGIKYGLEQMEENGLLRLSFERGDSGDSEGGGDALYVIVENTGPGVTCGRIDALNALLDDSDGSRENTSTMNIHRRMKLYFGQSYGIRFFLSELGGVKIRLAVAIGRERGDGLVKSAGGG
jgi:two-component system sensor histidine kinase YesM